MSPLSSNFPELFTWYNVCAVFFVNCVIQQYCPSSTVLHLQLFASSYTLRHSRVSMVLCVLSSFSTSMLHCYICTCLPVDKFSGNCQEIHRLSRSSVCKHSPLTTLCAVRLLQRPCCLLHSAITRCVPFHTRPFGTMLPIRVISIARQDASVT